ncbi:MAG TPA: chloride channel protein [Anaeromyxobacteraceae bacterium]|nr:chloride channel protein [Anaeromyxobacteraceae bacterium]
MQRRAHSPDPPGRTYPEPAPQPVFYRSFRDFLGQLPGVSQRFWVLVVGTGIISGLGSVALLGLLAAVKTAAWGTSGSMLEAFRAASSTRRVVVPLLGGLFVTAAMFAVKRRLGGHGTAGIIEAIWVHQGRLQLGRAFLRGFVSIVAVGTGASLGREGALLQTGAAAGSWLADRFHVTRRQARLLVACGAASGIAAAYNVPIGGALFGLEVLLGSFALELFGPVVVSCVTATIIARIVSGNSPVYDVPAYQLMRPSEVLVGLAMAPFLGVASAVFVKVMGWVEVQLYRVPQGPARFLPPVAMALVGVAAIWFPDLLGNGYDTANAALLGKIPLTLLLALPVLKLAASAICAGTGVPGGLFTPTLLFGALVGGALGELAQHVFPSLSAPPGAFALVGMAGVLAGTTHAAVSSVLIIFELTGDYGVILPLMLCAALAAATSRAIEPESLYTAPLLRRGVKLPELPRPEWLRVTPAAALVSRGAEHVGPSTPFRTVLPRLLAQPPGHDLYVLGEGDAYLGVIALDHLKGTIADEALLAVLVAADVMDEQLPPITTAMTLAEVAARFAEADLERLPVVDEHRRLVGTVSKRDVMKHARF